jgi:hypothetical protein
MEDMGHIHPGSVVYLPGSVVCCCQLFFSTKPRFLSLMTIPALRKTEW